MVTSDFWPGVEIWQFCACAMNNMRFNPYLRPNRRNSYVLSNTCTSRHQQNRRYGILLLCAQFSHGLVNAAMGQTPCSTECIPCCILNLTCSVKVKLRLFRTFCLCFYDIGLYKFYKAGTIWLLLLTSSALRFSLVITHIFQCVLYVDCTGTI